MLDLHPAHEAVGHMENEICRAEGLVRALYELIGEKVPEHDRDKHEAMFTVCTVLRETINKLDEKWKKAFDATKLLKQ